MKSGFLPGGLPAIAAAVAIAAAIAAPARAADDAGAYAGGSAGAVFVRDSTVDDDFGNHFEASLDPGFTIAGVGGYDFGRFRVDGHVRYLIADLDKFTSSGASARVRGDLQVVSVIFNGWIDFENSSILTPFVGAGVGAAAVRISDVRSMGSRLYGSDTATVFAYQAGAGLSFDVTARARLDIAYAYHATSDPSFESATAELGSGMVTLALRYAVGPRR